MRVKSSLHALALYGPVAVVVVACFFFAYQFVGPAPAKDLVIATGSPDGAYTRFAKRYAEILAQDGITLHIRTSAGSVENLGRLVKEDVSEPITDIAFVQGGTVDETSANPLYSLGSLYFEPLWVFYRSEDDWQKLSDLRGKRVAVGTAGSGTRKLAVTLLQDNDLDNEVVERIDQGGQQAADALGSGEIDAVMLVAGPGADIVVQLMQIEGVKLMNMRRAATYSRLHPYLSERVLHEGMIDLKSNIPATNVHLIAPTANLVVRDSVHPALLDLLLQAAKKVHSKGSWFEERGRFPSGEMLVYPLHPAAKRFYKYGPPFLQRYLPFWAATLVDRLKVMLLPLLVVLIPLFKIMPPIYNWRMRSRIYHWYKKLESVEDQLDFSDEPEQLRAALHELEKIQEDVAQVEVPLSFAGQAYDLRMHVELVRNQVNAKLVG